VMSVPPILWLEKFFLYATFTFTLVSGIHYILSTGHRLRKDHATSAAHPTGQSAH